jgi:chemotaxis protein histidine kinase CheA
MAATMRFEPIAGLAHALEELAERLEGLPATQVRSYLPALSESLACLGRLLDRIERGQEVDSRQAMELVSKLALPLPSAEIETPRERAPAELATLERRGRARHWRLDLRPGPHGSAPAQETVTVLGRVAALGRVVQARPPSLAPGTGRFHGALRLVLESTRTRKVLERELTAMVGNQGFTLEALPPPTAGEPSDEPPARWVRVRTDALDSMVEGLLDLRQELGRLKATLPSATGRVRDHLQRSEFELKGLYAALMELHLVPFDTLAQRLHQSVIEVAGELGKQVRFEIVGGDVQLDRHVLDSLIDPLMHALKNAVDHGLESPEERIEADKPACGSIRLKLERAGERVRIVVADDGRGLRAEVLRETAVALGVLKAEEARELTDDEALLLITLPRFTTRHGADRISGRGVGLDVVRERVEGIGGFIEIYSTKGLGCEVHMWVPLRRALVRSLLLRSAGELYALPIEAVVKSIDLDECGRDAGLVLIPLAERVGLEASSGSETQRRRVLVLAAADPPAGLVVDEVVGSQDLVVLPLHASLAHLREFTGAAVLEDGSIALVLDGPSLDRRDGIRPGA